MPERSSTGMARRARGRAAASAVLPRGVHAAGQDRQHRLSEQGSGLRPAVQGVIRGRADDRGRSRAPGRPHRHHRRAPYLGLDHDPSPACPYDRAGRRHRLGWQALAVVPAPLLAARARAHQTVPGADACQAPRRPQGRPAHLAERKAFAAYLAPLRRINWYVYSKPPFGGPKAVLAYLSRYTHRVAISNRRLITFDQHGVTFRYKDYCADGRARYKRMTLATDEFIRRFLIHVLPKGLHRIRHYGLLARSTCADNIARARELLAVSTPQDHNAEADAELPTPSHPCPCCGGRMITIEIFERGSTPRHRPTGPITAIRIDTS